MKYFTYIIVALLLFSSTNIRANDTFSSNISTNNIPIKDSVVTIAKHPKIMAALLTVTLGMFGAHRLYLGCKPWVPIFYVLTVGGVFFILPLIDLIAILASKDITLLYNNSNILMWLKD